MLPRSRIKSTSFTCRNDAMAPRDFLRVELNVTLLVPPEEQDRLVDLDAGPVGEREKVSRHGWWSVLMAVD